VKDTCHSPEELVNVHLGRRTVLPSIMKRLGRLNTTFYSVLIMKGKTTTCFGTKAIIRLDPGLRRKYFSATLCWTCQLL
jgi:hypothetical protein